MMISATLTVQSNRVKSNLPPPPQASAVSVSTAAKKDKSLALT